jgi:hypothetical protein
VEVAHRYYAPGEAIDGKAGTDANPPIASVGDIIGLLWQIPLLIFLDGRI